MANEYIFPTKLEGFIKVDEHGKYGNCCFSFPLPPDILKKMEEDREQLIKWIDSKPNAKGSMLRPAPWAKNGDRITYNYDGVKKKAPVFVDTDGTPLTKDVLKSMGKGTEVQLIVQQKPYNFGGAKGASLTVIGVRVHKLVTFSGASDKGELTTDDINSMFLKTEGYKQDAPLVTAEPSSYEPSYEVDF